MPRTPLAVAALVPASLPAAVPARADTDGFHRAGRDCIAFDVRNALRFGSGAHVVKIARFHSAGGPQWRGEVEDPDLHVHAMRCAEAGGRMERWGNSGDVADSLRVLATLALLESAFIEPVD